ANPIGVALAECYLPWMKKVWLNLKLTGAALKRNVSPTVTSSRSSNLKLMAPPKTG
ncbi:Hypothetical protein FKW44_024242, partial [Caligus rogercresseyi]